MSLTPHAGRRPELWAGVECTVNRVGELYLDQLERGGHARRVEDLELLAWLGARAARYPVLWERTAPGASDEIDWAWPDERLRRLRELDIKPIVGLVHHGSGPRHTSLDDPGFPEKLAAYARAVAERYPWVEDYTPVNEPLTTARFSGLYGLWYPHGRDGRAFARALLNQLRGVVLAMREVRAVNSSARLVQTEDLGKCFSTARLRHQAEFENERRWLTFDLLAGRVTRAHPMWDYLRWVGLGEREIVWFAENPCPPSVVGVNYYVTSERYLDHRIGLYPAHTHGGNGREAYADVEAVRVRAEGLAGARAALSEAWERYRLPLAVTEVHLGCTRDEQMRWMSEVWSDACALAEGGVDVRAVTAWAVLGSFDWDSLVTRDAGRYEPGAFDVRSTPPRPTATAHLIRDLAGGKEHEHPALAAPGWWRRLGRLTYAHAKRPARGAQAEGRGPLLLITGATGTLGAALARVAESRALPHRLLSRREMDIADPESVEKVLEGAGAWALVNAAGYVRVDDAERERGSCFRENALGPAVLAAACARHGVKLVTFSSDLVFGGRDKAEPYVESDEVSPLNVYGRSKAEAERLVLGVLPSALVVRTSAFFGPWDEYNFVHAALCALERGEEFVAAEDSYVTPTYVPALAHACLDLLIDGESGVWHLANGGAVTWADLARRAARLAGLDESLVKGLPARALDLAAPRPSYSALGSERGALLCALDEALECFMRERDTELSSPRRVRHVV